MTAKVQTLFCAQIAPTSLAGHSEETPMSNTLFPLPCPALTFFLIFSLGIFGCRSREPANRGPDPKLVQERVAKPEIDHHARGLQLFKEFSLGAAKDEFRKAIDLDPLKEEARVHLERANWLTKMTVTILGDD
ncbi:MAG: hypothetical protein P1V97_16955 [Planctomycetota bacterium]|nr:hypothetical protein [Planctomycetota bacterium]